MFLLTFGSLPADGPGVAQVRLVANDDEGEVFGVAGRGLDEELVPPVVQRLESRRRRRVVHQHAAVSSPLNKNIFI